MSDLIPALPSLVGWFMIVTGIALAALFITIAMGDDNDRR